MSELVPADGVWHHDDLEELGKRYLALVDLAQSVADLDPWTDVEGDGENVEQRCFFCGHRRLSGAPTGGGAIRGLHNSPCIWYEAWRFATSKVA